MFQRTRHFSRRTGTSRCVHHPVTTLLEVVLCPLHVNLQYSRIFKNNREESLDTISDSNFPSAKTDKFFLAPPPRQIGIRFQAVFIPVEDTATGDGKTEFFPDTYNYQTREWDDPKNIILLCTSQGSFVQQDGPGSQPQYLHKQVRRERMK